MIYKWIYKASLRLYPAEFRAMFAEEMLETFTIRLKDNGHSIELLMGELLDGMWSALVLHIDSQRTWFESLPTDFRTLYQARWIIRIGSLLNALFMVLVSLDPYLYNPEPEQLVMLVLFTMQLVCVLFAVRWERIGGIIMLTTTLTIAPIIFSGTALPGFELMSVLVTALWMLPFGSFAIAYLILGQRADRLRKANFAR